MRMSPRPIARLRWMVVAVLAAAVLAGHPGAARAQGTPFVPYFGKNLIHYDKFEWHIYTTDHFEIYYYPEMERHLERIAAYAESAYQKVSADLKHDLSFKVPLILFKTHSEFEQENVAPGEAQEGVGAFAEPLEHRMLMPIDDPPDLLFGLIVHELTHQFEFDIIPQSLIRRSVPLWVNEGLSDYERGLWSRIDLMQVRDAAVADIVPKMTELEGYGNSSSPRLIYNLGHAVFEFVEAKYGKEGIRQFLFALRKSVIGGGEDAYEEALRMKKDEFDQAFERYLKDRFKPFREKERTLIVQNVLTRDIELRIPMTTVDEPESPNFSPDGKAIVFDALRGGVGDIYALDLQSKAVTNLTDDKFADAAPVFSPDGTYIIYNVRVSGNNKLWRLDLDTKKKTQLTFGTQDETAAQFIDDHTIVFSSTATDPAVPLEPEVARNGNIYNIWTLDLKSGELRQYTDALGGNWSGVILNEGKTSKIAFISYYKGEYGIHTLERKEPLHTAASSDFGAPTEVIDFQAPLQHTLVKENVRKKRT